MALLDPINPTHCHLGHRACSLHTAIRPDYEALPGLDAQPAAGVCHYGCIASRLYFASHQGGRWYCVLHLRRALKAGGYPVPLDE